MEEGAEQLVLDPLDVDPPRPSLAALLRSLRRKSGQQLGGSGLRLHGRTARVHVTVHDGGEVFEGLRVEQRVPHVGG